MDKRIKLNIEGIKDNNSEIKDFMRSISTERYTINNNLQDIIINEVDSNYFKKEYFAPRPYSERLINSKLNDKNLNIMRDWKICLSEYLSRYNFIEFVYF